MCASSIVQEIKVLSQAHHPNLVQYYGARRSATGVELLMEYVSGGSLEQLLEACGPIREAVAQRYICDLLDGLIYLHNVMHVCHRDIKPGNVLLTSDGRCKLTDFGVSKMLSSHNDEDEEELNENTFMHTVVGTP
uniref:Protein kinase byr1 n=1 Tax=Lygus hesperus TaxID=30085 RepID=A0A0A9YYG5_LYGHE